MLKMLYLLTYFHPYENRIEGHYKPRALQNWEGNAISCVARMGQQNKIGRQVWKLIRDLLLPV